MKFLFEIMHIGGTQTRMEFLCGEGAESRDVVDH